MDQPLSRDALRRLLDSSNLHDITAAADAARRAKHALRTTVPVVQPFDPDGAYTMCPVTGMPAPEGGFPASLDDVHDAVTDLVLLPAPGADADAVRSVWRMLPGAPPEDADELTPTVQLGTTDTWIDAGLDHDFAAWRAQGVRVIDDGVDPRHHPARGVEGAAKWTSFWRAASNAGLRGHATVLYGPGIDLDAVFAQIDAIVALQADTNVFLSVSPSVIGPDGASPGDATITHASFDLRVLAACRLALPGVDHVSYRIGRGDLKTAHTALLCGVDDLVGELFLGLRDAKADAEARDLSLAEMQAWLAEAGFEGRVRNGIFATESVEDRLAWLREAG